MSYLSVNGVSLHYTTEGEGPPLLMIAGLASDCASWAPITAFLARERRLIMPDNRGCGQTKCDTASFSLDDIVDDYAALLDALAIRRVDILGHSMGGAIATALAARLPDRIGKAVIAATCPQTPARSRMVIDNLTDLREAGVSDEHWFRAFFCWLFSPRLLNDKRAVDAAIGMAIGYPYRQSVHDMRRQVEALRSADIASALPDIKAQLLILAGESDILFPPDEIRRQFAVRKDAEFQIIADAAHSLHWDAPEAFSEAVMGFLRQE